MPTIHPRYTITDTGPVRELLDDAQRRWPEISNRKQLLLRLAQIGRESLRLGDSSTGANQQRDRQRLALERLRALVDWDAIRDDQAWR